MLPNLGFGHLLVIIVVGLIVFGPNKLPEMMRKLGKAWKMVQSEAEQAQATLRAAVDDEAAPSVSNAVVVDRPDEMAIKSEAAAAEKAKPHTPKPRKTPAAKKTAVKKKSAPAKKTTAPKKSKAAVYPVHEDT